MVYTNPGYIRFGKGDVNICISIAGTADEPQAVLVFQNRDIPTEIGKIEENTLCIESADGIFKTAETTEG